MKKNTFKILFYLRGNQVNKEGKAPIMIRITVDGEIEQLNAKLYIEPALWDSKAGKAIGRSAKILELNSRLNDIQVLMKEHYYDLQNRHVYVTAEMVKNAYMGITAREESLLKLYEQHLEDTRKLVGLSKAAPTYRKYERMYRRVIEFMKKKYNNRPTIEYSASSPLTDAFQFNAFMSCPADYMWNYSLLLKNWFLDAWRNNSGTKRGKMSLETLIFTCQRETFTRFSLPLDLDRGNSFQNIRNKKKRYA